MKASALKTFCFTLERIEFFLKNIKEIIEKLSTTQILSKEEIILLLNIDEDSATPLFEAANQVRLKYMGNDVHLRGLIEISNHCIKSCNYCGLRKENINLTRYKMNKNEILNSVNIAIDLGYKTIVLQSGESNVFPAEEIVEIITFIKEKGLAVTLSLGEKDNDVYKLWKEVGADRYLLKHETADPTLYQALHPDMSFAMRRLCLKNLKDLNFQVGSGCMVGLPEQTLASLADDLLFMQEIDVEMAGIGPFIPSPNTPLAHNSTGTVFMTLKMLAIARLLMPLAHLPATTALGTIHPQGRQLALQAGANVIMPNITPVHYRKLYEIYPDRISLGDKVKLDKLISSLGRTIANDAGHSPKMKLP